MKAKFLVVAAMLIGLAVLVADGNTEPGSLKWKFKTGDRVLPSPSIGSDGTIYVGSDDSNLYAINPDGTEKWRVRVEANFRIASSPAIGPDNVIYVGCDGADKDAGYLCAINPDGTEKWRVRTGDWVTSSPAIGTNGTIYVGSYDGNLYAINPDGSIKWKFYTGNYIASSPAVSSDGTVYFGNKKKFYAIEDRGSYAMKKWSLALERPEDWVSSSPAIGTDGTIYVGSFKGKNDGNLYAINPDGSITWKFNTHGRIFSSPAISADREIVYVGSYDHNLYAINSTNDTQEWTFTTEGKIKSSPAIGSDGTIYIGSDDGNLYAIAPDGEEKWRFSAQGPVYSSPLIAPDGTIYVGSIDGNLYAIDGGPNVSLAQSPWPMFRHDPQHTGRVGSSSAYVPPLSGAPEILRIEFPSQIIGDGRENLGKVYFRDPDADITHAYFKPVEGTGDNTGT